jgi:hypothetical protein
MQATPRTGSDRMSSTAYERYARTVAMEHAKQKQADIEAVSREVPVQPGRPALRVIDGAADGPLRLPSKVKPL